MNILPSFKTAEAMQDSNMVQVGKQNTHAEGVGFEAPTPKIPSASRSYVRNEDAK